MEMFFAMISLLLIVYLIARNTVLSKKIDALAKNHIIADEHICSEIRSVECSIGRIHKRLDAIPSVIRDDVNRSLLALRENLETAKPIKPNNWDSVKEAFKGPVRNDINERN